MPDTNPPTWTAKYWASINANPTDKISVQKSDDTYLIYVNYVSSEVLTEDVDQDAVTAYRTAQEEMMGDSTGLIQQVDVNKKTKFSTYHTLARLVYLGIEIVGPIHKIYLISYKGEDVDSYDVRFIDKTNSSGVIAEVIGLINTEDVIIEIDNFNNLPTTKTRIDIQVRKVGTPNNDYVYIDSVLVKY